MFACLFLPPRVDAPHVRASDAAGAALVQLARDFSPRVETLGSRTVTLDIGGLGRLIGEPRTVGEELRRAAADAGLPVHIAVAATSTAAILVAHARAGLTVVAPGTEAAAVSPLPLDVLDRLPVSGFAASRLRLDTASAPAAPAGPLAPVAPELKRWGLRTLGDLASLRSSKLSTRLGQAGVRWQKWARGEEIRPLVPAGAGEQFEEAIDLEWPIEGLEPLSFVLARLLDPLCEQLERRDRGAVALRVVLTLVTRERHERSVELPAPIRDARVLRTLALLDLESHPPAEAIDRVAVAVDVTEGRVLQYGLFARALPGDTLATLMARLGALMGGDRVGAPALVDTYRPGAFAMAKFDPPAHGPGNGVPGPDAKHAPGAVLRRFRSPIPARVVLDQGRPVRVTTDRRGFAGGHVECCDGPWRSSGEWWCAPGAPHGSPAAHPWDCDEWDVTVSDGTTYRLARAHDQGTWFVEGILD